VASYWGCTDRMKVAEAAAAWVVVGTVGAVVPEMGVVLAAVVVVVVVEAVEAVGVLAAHLVVVAVAEMVDTAAEVAVAFLEAFGPPMVPAAALVVDVDRMAAYPIHHSEAVPDVWVARALLVTLLLVLGTNFLLVFLVLPGGSLVLSDLFGGREL